MEQQPPHFPEAILVDNNKHHRIFDMDAHPVAGSYPLLDEERYRSLVESIRETGCVINPLDIYQDQVIDGRDRIRAIKELLHQGVEVSWTYRDYSKTPAFDVVTHVRAAAQLRKHLSQDQLAAAAVFASKWKVEEEAKKRQQASLFGNRGKEAAETAIPNLESRTADAQSVPQKKWEKTSVGILAKQSGTKKHRVERAVRIEKEHGKDALLDISRGKKTFKDFPLAKASCKTAKEPLSMKEQVQRQWTRLKEIFPVEEYPEVRRILHAILNEEDRLVSGKTPIKLKTSAAKSLKRASDSPSPDLGFVTIPICPGMVLPVDGHGAMPQPPSA